MHIYGFYVRNRGQNEAEDRGEGMPPQPLHCLLNREANREKEMWLSCTTSGETPAEALLARADQTEGHPEFGTEIAVNHHLTREAIESAGFSAVED